MKAVVLKDAKILIPNKEHKNFTDSGKIIEEDSIVIGEPKNISGLRRGEDFVYKLFLTNKNQLIHLNKIKPMNTTEVTLGADAQVSATDVNLVPAEKANRMKWYGAVAGAVLGFAYAKYRKHDMKHIAKWIAIGSVAGFGAGYLVDMRKNKVVIKPSK